MNILGDMLGTSGEAEAMSEGEAFSLDENQIKLSDFLAIRGKLTENEVAEFRRYSEELIASEKLKKSEREWLADYLKNLSRLDKIIVEHATGVMTPPLPARPDSRSMPVYEQVDKQAIRAPTIKLNELVIRPVVFDGTKPEPRKWIEDYDNAAEANGWSDAVRAKYMQTFLSDSARDWLVTLAKRRLGSTPAWPDLRASFIRHYLGDTDKNRLRRQIATTFQRPDEKAAEFIPRLLRLLTMLEPRRNEEDLVEEIRAKLRGFYQDKLALLDIQTLDKLNDACLRVEAGAAAAKSSLTRESNYDKRNRQLNEAPSHRERRNNFNQDKGRRNEVKQRFGKTPPNEGRSNQKPHLASVKCYRCERMGHYANKCKASKNESGVNIREAATKPKTINMVDREAGPMQDGTGKIAATRSAGSHIIAMTSTGHGFLEHEIVCNGQRIKAVIDTGAVVSVVEPKVVEKYGWKMVDSSQTLSHAGGGNLQVLGEVAAEINLKGQGTISTRLIVVAGLCAPLVIGLDVLGKLKATINLGKADILLSDNETSPNYHGIRVNETILPPRSRNLVIGNIKPTANTIMCVPFNFDANIIVAHSICQVKNGKIPLLVTNLDRQAVVLREGQQVSSVAELETDNDHGWIGAIKPNEIKIGKSDEVVMVGNLSDEQLNELTILFDLHKDAFSVNNSIGRTKLVEHQIELVPGTKPIVEPMRRHPPQHELEAERQVKKMLEDGIIEHSSSPWASEYVLVRKKGGDMRLCIDFRKLNSQTKKNSYPLPNAESCIESLAGKKYYSKLDFASGYWQVPMEEKSREYTAFRTPLGLYQFTVMPFGLCNAPASFQRMMNALLSGLRGLELQVYLDDVCLATDTWSEHMELLKQTLKLVIDANLKLKSSKCLFGVSSINFLGHVIDQHGVRQDPDKLRALTELPRPKDVSGVRRILGGFSYYRKFVPRFADVVEPLTRLTRKNATFQWNVEHQNAFDRIKKELLKNGTLAFIDNTGALRLKTDASRVGIGGILLQAKDKEWRIICCTSRRLNVHEQNYAATELEGLAIVYCVSKFRHYLLGRHFKIFTDHCALCALKLKNSPNQRLQRWSLLLSEYDFEIQYVRGDKHEDADCISRAPVRETVDDFGSHMLALTYPVNKTTWLDNDEESTNCVELANNNQSNWRMINGLPYFSGKLFVPKSKRAQMVVESHDHTGHNGVAGTMDKLKSVFWPGQNKQVADYVKNCVICQRRKVERSLPMANFHNFKVNHPLEVISVDYMGPVTESAEGCKFVCVAIDNFSRFIVAEAMPNQAAVHFQQFLRKFVAIFGAPSTMISDNGKQFNNEGVKMICTELQIEHKTLAPYHHRGNAIVERAIESLQEKLHLQCKTDDADWQEALPKVVQQLNQNRHTSLNYSPYEVLFSRTAKTNYISVTEPVVELSSELVRGEARNKMRMMSEKSKKYFGKTVKQPTFQLGDMVWTKLKDRRLPKLADKFEGPYKIVEMEEDVYKLESQNKDKKIMRHCSYLKPYYAAMLLTLITLLITIMNSNAQIILRQTGPIFWTELKDKYVSEGSEHLPYEIYFTSPCPLLLKYDYLLRNHQARLAHNAIPAQQSPQVTQLFAPQKSPQPQASVPIPTQMSATAPQPQQIQSAPSQQQQQHSSSMMHFKIQTPIKPIPIITQPLKISNQATALPQNRGIPTHILNTVNDHLDELDDDEEDSDEFMDTSRQKEGMWMNQDELMRYRNRTKIKRANTNNLLYDKCEEIYTSTVMAQINLFNQPTVRHKRVVSFILGFLLSNVIDTVKDKYFSDKSDSSFEDRWAHAQNQLRILNDKTDILALAQKAQAQLHKHTIMEINAINTRIGILPTINILADYIIAEMHNKKQLLNRLYFSLAEEKADLITLAQLFGTVHFDKLLAQDVVITSTKSPSPGVLIIGVDGRMRSNDTRVFKVNAFSHYQNLSGTPVRLDYTGKTMLIKNFTSNCVKSIETDNNEFVQTKCLDNNYRDPSLQLWRRTVIKDINSEPRHSSYALLWPDSIVYCWGHNVTISTKKTVTTTCPHYAFLVNTTSSFNTSDQLVVHNGKESQKLTGLEADLDVFDVHFQTFDASHTEYSKSLNKILHLTKLAAEMNEQSVLFKVNGQEVHSHNAIRILLWVIPTVIGIWVLRAVYTNHIKRIIDKWNKRKNREDMVAKQVDQRLNTIISRIQENRRSSRHSYEPPIRLSSITRGTYG